jgi:hypothetical protein
MSIVWTIWPARQRKEDVRTHWQGISIYRRATHVLPNTWRDKSIEQKLELRGTHCLESAEGQTGQGIPEETA